MIQAHRTYVERRWLHGKLVRKVVRMWCRILGHDFSSWHFDWPYDAWHPEMGEERDPHPWEELHWIRGCARDCGCVETAKAQLDAREFLPGEATGIEDNVIRRNANWS